MNKTLSWVKAHELPTGGIEAWDGYGRAYPEVTGYLMPTLWKYGEHDLCHRLADWLASEQDRSGGWHGLDGQIHTFDSGAIYEGLEAVYNGSRAIKYIGSMLKARRFIEAQRMTGGCYKRNPLDPHTECYTMRAGAMIGDRGCLDYWTYRDVDWFVAKKQRAHYIAYALEGIWRMGEQDYVRRWLERAPKWIDNRNMMPFWVYRDDRSEGNDTTATCQWAILFSWAGDTKTARQLRRGVEGMLNPSGGLRHDRADGREISWAAKYYLDLLLEDV
jgi:hypothetical protein